MSIHGDNIAKTLNEERFELIKEVVILRRWRLVLTIAVVILVAGLLGGCSTLTEKEQEDRDYRNLETRLLHEQCQRLVSRNDDAKDRGWKRVSTGRIKSSPMQMRTELVLNHCPKELL